MVPRRFPACPVGRQDDRFNQGSGRLQLADTVAHHPLAARVAVNRIWMASFRPGMSVRPRTSARRATDRRCRNCSNIWPRGLVERKYSVKAMIREIVLIRRVPAIFAGDSANDKTDPENRYLAPEPAALRSGIAARFHAAVSGELDRTVGGESKPLDAEFRRRTSMRRPAGSSRMKLCRCSICLRLWSPASSGWSRTSHCRSSSS